MSNVSVNIAGRIKYKPGVLFVARILVALGIWTTSKATKWVSQFVEYKVCGLTDWLKLNTECFDTRGRTNEK